jgi:hypothetical protein
MEALTTAATNAIGLVGTVFTAMTGNALLELFLGASVVGVGISVFRRLKGAAR